MNANEYPSAVAAGAALAQPPAILSWLRPHRAWPRGRSRLCPPGRGCAGSIEVASGEPGMAMCCFNGGDPTPTHAQFQALVAAGEVRYLLVQGGGAGVGIGGPVSSGSSISAIDAWAASVATAVDTGSSGGGALYDLSGAISSGS